jgi:hypothetical protein
MKELLKIFLFASFIFNNSLQIKAQETSGTFNNIFYVRIDTLKADLKNFSIDNGKITFINILLYKDSLGTGGFHTMYNNANLLGFNKENINPHDIISYNQLYKVLHKNAYNIIMFCKIYFIIGEDRFKYMAIQVRPVGYLQE